LRPAAARRLMRRLLPIGLVVLVGVALTFTLAERYHHRVLTLVLVWATMGLAWNIISGYAGQTSFGHQAFFGIGAYVTVLLVVTTGLTPWIGMAAGLVAALGGTLLLSHWIEGSRLGYALRALKANEQAAEAAGVDTFRAKMVAYMLSAAPAAVIGAIYAHAILFVVTPDAVFGVLVIVQ